MKNKKNLKTLKAIARKNLSKVFFSLFLIVVLESFISFAFATPALWLFNRTDLAIYSKILAYALLFLGVFLWFMIHSGFSIMLLRMVRQEYFTIGYLFYAFHKFKRFAPVSLLYTVLVAIVSVAIHFALRFLLKSDIPALESFIQKIGEDGQIIAVLVVLLLVLCVFLYFLIFINNFCYDNPKKSVFYFAKQSIKLVFKQGGRLFVFIFQSGGFYLLRAIFYFFISAFLSSDKNASALKLLALVFNFLYFVSIYKSLSLMFLSIPVFYDDFLHSNKKTKDELESEELSAEQSETE